MPTTFFNQNIPQGAVIFFSMDLYILRGHRISHVGNHKMTTDSVFILFKKTDFYIILACLGVRCIDGGGHNSFDTEMGGGGEGPKFITL